MIRALVEIVSPSYVLLLSEEDLFEVVLVREWLPPDTDPGDPVKLHFKLADEALLMQEMQREGVRRPKALPNVGSSEVWNYMSFKKYRKTVGRLPQHLTRIDSLGVQFALVDSLTSDYGLLTTGEPYLKVLVPRNWLPEQLGKAKILDVFVQLEGYWVPRVHLLKKFSNQWEKAHLPYREEVLKLAYDRERDNG